MGLESTSQTAAALKLMFQNKNLKITHNELRGGGGEEGGFACEKPGVRRQPEIPPVIEASLKSD